MVKLLNTPLARKDICSNEDDVGFSFNLLMMLAWFEQALKMNIIYNKTYDKLGF